MSRCVAYLRVSTERQAGDVQTSLAEQEQQLAHLASRFGVEVERWYRDEGASGASVEARPAFRQLLADCAASRCFDAPGLVLVYDDSRFGRFPDPDEAAYWRHHLRKLGWVVRFAVGDDVEDVSFRHILRAIGGAQSSEERAKIRRRARAGKRGSAQQGFWTTRAPFGYRRKVVYPPGADRVLEPGQHKASSERVKLVPHAEEAALVRDIFERYAAGGVSLGTLAEELKVRWPAKPWTRTLVQHLIRNPAYVGDVVGGKRPADRADRLVTPIRPESEWYACRDAHEAIVTRETFEAAQQRLAGNRRLGRGVRVSYLLTGLLCCSDCGTHYAGGGHSALQRRGKPAVVRFYREVDHCGERMGTVSRHLVDDAVVSAVGTYVRNPAVRRRLADVIGAELERAAGTSADSIEQLRTRLAAAEARKQRLIAAIADGILTADDAAAHASAANRQIEELQARIDHARRGARRSGAQEAERRRLLALALDFPTRAAAADGAQLRDLVTDWLSWARFDKRARTLSLGIHRLPTISLFRPYDSPGQG